VQHLGVTDTSLRVQSYALTYVSWYALRDFAENYPAYFEWYESAKGKPVDQVLAQGVQWYLGQLKNADSKQREVFARQMFRSNGLDALKKRPQVRTLAIEKGLLDVLTQWVKDPAAGGDLLDGAMRGIRSLQPDAEYIRTQILPHLDQIRSNSGNARAAALDLIAHTGAEWAYQYLILGLGRGVRDKQRTEIWTYAQAVAEMKDARAIPVGMVGQEQDQVPG
jgi:hypothetical protein